MKIELRRVNYSAALSQETAAYSAEIWIDGKPAFHARNAGTGGADFYRQLGSWTESEVNRWLKANRPPCRMGDIVCDHDLEIEVSGMLSRAIERRRVLRLLRTNLITIEQGLVLQYPLRQRPLDTIIRAVRATNPEAIIVNGAGEAVLSRALNILLASG